MNMFIRLFYLASLMLLANLVNAKTFKYELINVYANEGYELRYPGLELNSVKSAAFAVSKDPLLPDWQLNSLEINFNKAAKLTATGFKKVSHNTYRAVINDVWIYRQLIVDVKETDLNAFRSPLVHIEVYVSEKNVFNQPEVNQQGQLLLTVAGSLQDVSPNKIIDTGFITLDGKRVNFSLRERPGILLNNGNSQEGFLIDVLWMGKGQKTIALPLYPKEDFDQFDAIALIIEEIDGDFGAKEQVLSVKYKDLHNSELMTWRQPIRPLLNAAYGVMP